MPLLKSSCLDLCLLYFRELNLLIATYLVHVDGLNISSFSSQFSPQAKHLFCCWFVGSSFIVLSACWNAFYSLWYLEICSAVMWLLMRYKAMFFVHQSLPVSHYVLFQMTPCLVWNPEIICNIVYMTGFYFILWHFIKVKSLQED